MIERLATVPRLLVACDFDGTLAPIVDDSHTARAIPESLEALRDLAHLPDTTVAVISGRTHRELHERFGTDGFVLIGEHGADRGEPSPEESPALRQARRLVESAVDRTPGATVEHKGRSVAFHHRRAADGAEAVADLRSRASGIDGLSMMEGKAVLELSVSHETKGTALGTLREALAVDAVVFIGDDVTDETVFEALGETDLGVKVGDAPTAARMRVTDPDEVADILHRLAALRAGAV